MKKRPSVLYLMQKVFQQENNSKSFPATTAGAKVILLNQQTVAGLKQPQPVAVIKQAKIISMF